MAVAIAVTRAFARSGASTIGNFWVDMTRATLYVLLPIAIIVALVFVAMGLPQTLDGFGRRDDAGRRQADDRARPYRLARKPSSSSAPMAAASSTSMPPIPSRTPMRFSNYLNIVAMLSVSAALLYTFGQIGR
jgi:K+-transporting ATPase ATPase A chain